MTLLVDRACLFCKNVEEVSKSNSDIKILYIIKGMIQYDDGLELPLDSRIPILPALVVGEDKDCKIYCGEKLILDFLNQQVRRTSNAAE
jgi:hypothetical protein